MVDGPEVCAGRALEVGAALMLINLLDKRSADRWVVCVCTPYTLRWTVCEGMPTGHVTKCTLLSHVTNKC